MPYRDPVQRVAWMQEYRKRKRVQNVRVPALLPSEPAVVRAPEHTRVTPKTIGSSGPQPTPANIGIARKRPSSSFKTALELARMFPFAILPPRYAHIATTPAIVLPAQGAAIVEGTRNNGCTPPAIVDPDVLT